ncbi:HEAT repeat domain-containing protein [Halococcoides cellulosivorans]|uniref:Phycocyanin alpha phycocyanobilin lyase n=1 Tax=Halococcoides cellulosivorans TaxID=1679096 RepID=A0A2R4X1N2_9EURY|nr:HEAT repeat domain-containing protein [Halococcoides cellulosivorans]AWB27700.1 phycocyanin alpha phycocyanobilin lyase [Halococcoides cellulosivorans]
MSLYELQRDGDVQGLIETLRDSTNDEVRRRAAAYLGEFPNHQDRDDAISALVRVAQEGDTDAVVAAAIDALDQLGEDAVQQLIGEMTGMDLEAGADWKRAKAFARALDADIPEIRMAAANALGSLGEADAVGPLTDRLDDPDPRVRARVARACGQIGDPRAVAGLTEHLQGEPAGVRAAAAGALGEIGNREALQALLAMYDDENDRVRRIAVDAYGNFRNDRPVDALIEALDDPSATVRRTAVYSLIEVLANVPTDRSHEIRETVVETLKEADEESVVEPLTEILAETTQDPQRRNSAWLLGRVATGDRGRVVDTLVTAMDDDDQMAAQFAATSLAEIGGTTVEGRLIDVLEDTDRASEVRAQAAFVLGKVGDDRARRSLESVLEESDDEAVRERAFSALSKLGGHGGRPSD